MKIFDFPVKIALFGAFLFFLGDLGHKLRANQKINPGSFPQRTICRPLVIRNCTTKVNIQADHFLQKNLGHLV